MTSRQPGTRTRHSELGEGEIETTFAHDAAIAEGQAGRRSRLVVLLICSSSLFVIYLDSTILNVALPTLEKDLHACLSGLQWVSDAYLLVVASLLMLTGSTADRLGRKRLFLVGLAGFSLGSLLCSLAPNTGSLIGCACSRASAGRCSPRSRCRSSVTRSTTRRSGRTPSASGRASSAWRRLRPVVGGLLVSARSAGGDLLGQRADRRGHDRRDAALRPRVAGAAARAGSTCPASC